MSPQNDDRTLLQRWADGDTKAGGELLERHFRPLHRFLINKVPESDIVDLIQETMLACVSAKETFRGDASFKTFLFGIAHKKLLHFYRRHRRKEGRLDPLSEASADFIDPTGISSQLARRREQELLLAAMRTIPLDHQVVLELHFWEGLSARECAAILDVPTSTIKGRLSRAKRSLKAALEEGPGSVEEKRSISSAMASWILGIHDHIRRDSPEAQRILRAWDEADQGLEAAGA
jgi:RNA polymerase sigma-70 factor (ECF subfamily)